MNCRAKFLEDDHFILGGGLFVYIYLHTFHVAKLYGIFPVFLFYTPIFRGRSHCWSCRLFSVEIL